MNCLLHLLSVCYTVAAHHGAGITFARSVQPSARMARESSSVLDFAPRLPLSLSLFYETKSVFFRMLLPSSKIGGDYLLEKKGINLYPSFPILEKILFDNVGE